MSKVIIASICIVLIIPLVLVLLNLGSLPSAPIEDAQQSLNVVLDTFFLIAIIIMLGILLSIALRRR